MQIAENFFEKYAVYKMKRKAIEALFASRINSSEGTRKVISPSYVAWMMRLARLNTKNDLIAFYFMCDNSQNFAKKWWWELKPRPRQTSDTVTVTVQQG